jgi:DNA polymerase-3 subunit beta
MTPGLLEEYPELPAAKGKRPELELDVAELQAAWGTVAVAVSKDPTRPVLVGVCFSRTENGVSLASTDSYRLAVDHLRTDTSRLLVDEAIIPAVNVAHALALAKATAASTVRVSNLGDLHTRFDVSGEHESVELFTRKIDGTFPNVKQLVPGEEEVAATTTFDRRDALVAVGRLAKIATENNPVRVTLSKKKLLLALTQRDEFTAGDEIATDTSGNPGREEYGFNPQFLLDGIAALEGPKITLHAINPLRPALLRGEREDALYLLMPVRLA